ncbi:MAG TPA: WYL domain-containing protein [Planctomicrobium sp.]|nr:WYL domain-containing protein [Planctomicrobium sp.]
MLTAKRPALRRLWMIDRSLRAKQYPTAKQLAEIAEVDDKTIRRDLEMLRDTYLAPVEYNHSKGGWGYTDETYHLPAVLITEGELLALFLASQTLQMVQGTSHANDLQRAIQKLSEFLPDTISLHWQALDQAQSFRQTVTTLHDIDIFRELVEAALHSRQLRVRYWTASRDAESERVIDPYHLAYVEGSGWYLLAYCHARKATRMFAPARIRELSQTGETFTRPADFKISDFFDGTFKVVSESTLPLKKIRLRFTPSAAKYIREQVFHATQQLEKNADGSVVLELSLRSLIEVRRWILSWGSECEVLEPAELKADIRREAAAILKQSTARPEVSTTSTLEKIQQREKRRQGGRQKRIG